MTISRWILLRMRNVSHTSCRENQNTHFTFSNFFPENRAIYEIIRKIMVEPGRPQMTIIWRMGNACWTTKTTDTHSEYVKKFCFSTATMVTRTRLYVTLMRTFQLTFFTSPVPNFTDRAFCTASVPHVHTVSTISTFVAATVNKWLYAHPFWHHITVSLYRCHDHRNCHGMSWRMQAP
jgi:hypothetical protein